MKNAANSSPAIAVHPQKKKIKWKIILPFYGMILPGLIYLFINNYLPMFGIVIAFKKLNFAKGIFGSPWSGFSNFKFLFATQDAMQITRNTILYNIAFFIVSTIVAVSMAILIDRVTSKRLSKRYQSILLLPYTMSWVVIGYLGYAFFGSEAGLINHSILKPLGLEPVNWYMDKRPWPFILVFFHCWKTCGYSMIIYLSSIVGINHDYYEAAVIDGASDWQQIAKITLPLLKPTLITLFILAVGRVFRSDFGLFYQIPRNSGILYSVTRTIDVYVYQALMKNSDFTKSSAASVYQAIVGFVLIVTANWVVKKVNPDNSLF